MLVPLDGPRDAITLGWREATVPATAAAGDALLLLPDGRELARWTLDVPPRLDDSPEFALAVGESLGTLARLAGYTLADTSAGTTDPLEVTLVWQAGAGAAQGRYTVFVHLLNDQGQIIAQSDSITARGARPTSGWRAGEYILDRHELRFNALAQPGSARLIVGMYDARSGERVAQWPGNADHIALPGEVKPR